ncbi:30S ribosomal protein S3 [Wohlfahrtiimonas populi]|uniref:30S ribosomal protein S3 n=1 Tax=Wohlfahrtiimonas populi TaxID=1940240 RepID=UPI00098D4396|nr:30S ribosomal protein S3 [Wohlfahrtiimonas populi]
MGQKVNPTGIRLGISKDWNSRWYANSKEFPEFIEADFRAREFLRKELASAAVSKIQITRPSKSAQVTIFTARPGIVIGKKGEDIEKLRTKLTKIMGCPVHVAIEEIKKPELDAYLVAEGIAQQLERRVMFRRAMKRAVTNTMKVGAEGIRVNVSGRLNGAEIARMEWYREGRVPLHTLRANIDYGTAEALTTYGILGIKVWIYKGEVFDYQKADEQPEKGRRSKKRGE